MTQHYVLFSFLACQLRAQFTKGISIKSNDICNDILLILPVMIFTAEIRIFLEHEGVASGFNINMGDIVT